MKVLKIADVVSDEKFIDGVIECQDLTTITAEHEYVVVSDSNYDFRYISKYKNRVKYISPLRFLSYLEEKKIDAVFLHSFCVLSSSLIVKIPLNIKVFWFSWGYDIYNFPLSRPFVRLSLYGDKTSRILPQKRFSLKSIIKELIGFRKKETNIQYKALNRIDYYSGVLEYEYELLKSNSEFRAKPVSYQYSNLSILFAEVDEKVYDGNNILIGNSGNQCNNHVDIIQYLQNVEIKRRKIYMPLSYAGVPEYISKVKSFYEKSFGGSFAPLDTFIPYNEYLNLISSCSVAIFAHERQQAIGNINMALQNGCKVFLSETNKVYGFYKSLGIVLFSLQSDLSQVELDTPLTKEQVMNNKQILHSRYCKETYMNNLMKCYEYIQ